MELIETLNDRLEKFYGHFEDGRPNFRIVWSDDQYEVRFGTFDIHSPNGLYLRTETGYKHISRYPYMEAQWVLERLIGVPDINKDDLTTKSSYEPIWGFSHLEAKNTPEWDMVKQIVDKLISTIYAIRNELAKYKPKLEETNTADGIALRRENTRKALFDGESDAASTALHLKQGVVVPNTYGDEK